MSSNTTAQQLQINALRAAIRVALQCLRGSEAAHIVVDVGRPRQSLRTYLQRVLRDTAPGRPL